MMIHYYFVIHGHWSFCGQSVQPIFLEMKGKITNASMANRISMTNTLVEKFCIRKTVPAIVGMIHKR